MGKLNTKTSIFSSLYGKHAVAKNDELGGWRYIEETFIKRREILYVMKSGLDIWKKYLKGIIIGFLIGSLGGLLMFILAFTGIPLFGTLFYIVFPIYTSLSILFPSVSVVFSFLLQGIVYAIIGGIIHYLFKRYHKKNSPRK